MGIDSINVKPNKPSSSPKKPKNFIIPIIIIIIIIAAFWLISLKYNFSRIDSSTQKKDDPASQEVNAALKNLTEDFDKLKQTKIFKSDNNTPSPPSNPSTTTQPQPLPPNQY